MYTVRQQKSIHAFRSFVGLDTFTRKDIVRFTEETGEYKKLGVIRPWFLVGDENRISKGLYRFPSTKTETTVSPVPQPTPAALVEKAAEIPATAANLMMVTDVENMVPEKFNGFVPWGHFRDIKNIIKSKIFYPIFVTGLSGNGKTLNVSQACAELNREMVRVNITIETDEDDLIGGFRLVNGETKFNLGPVAQAMEKGAVLLLDEIDLASNKIMCLQPVLEGNGIYIKKINRYIKPAPGFTVIATANTKGKGSDDGRFIGTNILKEAFLERFPITVVQSYLSKSIENKILRKFWKNQIGPLDEQAEVITENLVEWAIITRDSFENGTINDLITNRRLISILQTYRIFGDVEESIKLTVNRFDDITRESFVDLYKKLSEVSEEEEEEIDESLVVQSGETKAWFEN